MSGTDQKVRAPVGVVSVGAAVPAGRLEVSEVAAAWDASGRGRLAVCGPDEDSLTLAWRAVSAALDAAGVALGEVGGLWWGTARPPMAEGPSFAYLCTAVGLDDRTCGLLASGSTHAGMDALDAGCHALAAGAVEVAVVVTSDALVPGLGTGSERSTGAGAVALVLRRGEGAAAQLVRRAFTVRPILDRYRGSDQPGTGDPYDPRLYRERELIPTVSAASAALGDVPEGARWSVPDPDGKLGKAVAKAIGVTTVSSDGLFPKIGDAGCAQPLLGALAGLAEPGPLAVVAEGGGRSSAWLFDVAQSVPGVTAALAEIDGAVHGTRAVGYMAVLRARGQVAPLSDPIPMGVPPGSAAFVRGNQELLGLMGRACDTCGTIAVPPSIHPVCPTCGAPGGRPVRLSKSGRVHTFVVNHTMPAPFEAPLPICVVDLDDGARVMLQGMPDDAADMAVGDRVTLELRRYALERGAPVYGFKVRRDK